MTASLLLAAGLACAQLAPTAKPDSSKPRADALLTAEAIARPRTAVSKIVAVTVYQGQALVTREVNVPEGAGTFELVVTPMPAQAVDGSLYTEGSDRVRVLRTQFRSRAVKEDTSQEVRAKEDLIKKLQAEVQRLQSEIGVDEQDLAYLKKLEGFTSASLSDLTKKGRLESAPIVSLSKFVMDNRSTKTKSQTELRRQLQSQTEAIDFAKRQLAELSAGISRIERDAVIVVNKTRPQVNTVRLGYLVGAANWWPQYRLRGGPDKAPVGLDYLAAVVQQTGEPWTGVAVTLSTARPSLDAAPPELLPLKMDVAEPADSGPIEARDDASQRIVEALATPIKMSFVNETPLEDVIKYVKQATTSPKFPAGIPIYVDPVGLQEAEKSMTSTVAIDLQQVPLRASLRLLLKQLGLTYRVTDGLVKIVSIESESDRESGDDEGRDEATRDVGQIAGMAGMAGGPGLTFELADAAGAARLNRAAATDQAAELRVADGRSTGPLPSEKDSPSVTFSIAGQLDIPARRDPQLLEVSRFELPAEYYAKAVPVLTQRVYRLAKLTNKSDFVLLPGEATVYVGSDFVGRMRLPLVAIGEPFVAGFGADPQLQVSRRLVNKSRTIQGGNQIFDYEFRLGLRNYRSDSIKIQLWDRLPKPKGETVAVHLVNTSAELSKEPIYQRTARADNLLRWDLELPPGTTGDKTIYLTYEFRLEYARDLPRPQFISGGLREGPIGGGAMGGMSGGMGGMMSIRVGDQ
jgi:hypothetical protein